MKKIVKLVSSLLAVILILNCLCMSTLAATIPDPYHAILTILILFQSRTTKKLQEKLRRSKELCLIG